MNRTLYKVVLEGQYSNREDVVANVIQNINGLEIYKVYKFKTLFVWVYDTPVGALQSLKAVTGIHKIRPWGGEEEIIDKKDKDKDKTK